MKNAEKLFLEIGKQIKGAQESKMFGKLCFKINGKAFIAFFKDSMVFKLTDKAHKEALSLDGSELFDPSEKKKTHERMGPGAI